MKPIKQFLRMFMFATLLSGVVVTMNACGDDGEDGPEVKGDGTVTGTVTEDTEEGNVISGVTVAVSGNASWTATTDANGKYTIPGVTIASHSVSFTKEGYETLSTSVSAKDFIGDDKIATANAKMRDASYAITGTVINGNDGTPMEGVVVAAGTEYSATTDATGVYLISNVALDDYTVTATPPVETDFAPRSKTVTTADFNAEKIATADFKFGGGALLPGGEDGKGYTAEDLKSGVQYWRYNEYRGGNSAHPFDWSENNMWGMQVEGTAITSDNYCGVRVYSNPLALEDNPAASTTEFDSYMYGRKKITEDNKILTVVACSTDSEATTIELNQWAVQVINIESGDPQNTTIRAAGQTADNVQTFSQTNEPYVFDLSDYVGEEVIIAIGIFRVEDGNYNRNLFVKRIMFTPAEVADTNEIVNNFTLGGGTAITEDNIGGWFMTQEMVSSTMSQPGKEFTGITSEGSNRYEQRQWWAKNSHIGWEWALLPLHKDLEPNVSQGFIMKCRANTVTNIDEPEAYIYAKFDITPANDKFTLYARNDFGSNDYSHARLTAIDASDFSVTHIDVDLTESSTLGGTDGLRQLKHLTNGVFAFDHQEGDGSGSADDYGKFVFDLSQFDGKSIVLCLGVYKGDDTSTTENKLCMYSMKFE